MHIFYNRPLAFSAFLFAVCAIFSYRMLFGPKLGIAIVASLFLLFLMAFSLFRKHFGKKMLFSALCMGAVALSFWSSFFYFQVRYAKYRSYADESLVVEGVVLERSASQPFYSSLSVSLDRINGSSENVRAELVFSYPSALQVGDRFCAEATAVDISNVELINSEETFLSDGKMLYLTVSDEGDCEILPATQIEPRVLFSRFNTRLSYALRNRIGGEEGGIAAALLLGNRTWISDYTTLIFRRAGISHLLALSGLHVSILIGFAELILRRFRVPKIGRAFVICLLAFGYLALSGFSLSTCRAVLMMVVTYLGFLLGDDYDSFTGLCVVLFLILLITPYAVLDSSMWMSFLAACGIIVFSPALEVPMNVLRTKLRLPGKLFLVVKGLFTALSVGVVANLALMLYTAFLFGEISMASVPATLLLSIPVTLLLYCSAIAVCIPFLPILPECCAFLSGLMLRVAGVFSDIENVMMPADGAATKICLTLMTAMLIFLAVAKLKRAFWAIPVPLLLALTICVTQAVTLLSVNELPVTIPAGAGEVRLYGKGGVNVLVNDTRGNASEAYEIKLTATADYCTEVNDLVFCRYYNQATYFVGRLAGEVMVRRMHLPKPSDDRDRAIARRLEQEAALYGIEVEYDAEAILARLEP